MPQDLFLVCNYSLQTCSTTSLRAIPWFISYITAATERYMRPHFRIKSLDCLFTTKSVVKWCDVNEHQNPNFNLQGCILFLLLVKSGSLSYPAYQPTGVCEMVAKEHISGWSVPYSELKVKYSKTMHQSNPQLTKPSRGSTVDNEKLEEVEDVDQIVTQLKLKRKRHLSGEGTSS